MFSNPKISSLFCVSMVLIGIAQIVPSVLNSTSAQQEERFIAVLNGSEVSPPVNTGAKGDAEFILHGEQPIRLFYNVSVTGIDSNSNNVTGVHLHNGVRGFNGTVIAELPIIHGHERNGILAVGNLNGSSNFTNELSGKGELTISSLINYIGNNTVYLDIHTADNPSGELRGQVSRLP
jgi:CHRD domain-containing protein